MLGSPYLEAYTLQRGILVVLVWLELTAILLDFFSMLQGADNSHSNHLETRASTTQTLALLRSFLQFTHLLLQELLTLSWPGPVSLRCSLSLFQVRHIPLATRTARHTIASDQVLSQLESMVSLWSMTQTEIL